MLLLLPDFLLVEVLRRCSYNEVDRAPLVCQRLRFITKRFRRILPGRPCMLRVSNMDGGFRFDVYPEMPSATKYRSFKREWPSNAVPCRRFDVAFDELDAFLPLLEGIHIQSLKIEGRDGPSAPLLRVVRDLLTRTTGPLNDVCLKAMDLRDVSSDEFAEFAKLLVKSKLHSVQLSSCSFTDESLLNGLVLDQGIFKHIRHFEEHYDMVESSPEGRGDGFDILERFLLAESRCKKLDLSRSVPAGKLRIALEKWSQTPTPRYFKSATFTKDSRFETEKQTLFDVFEPTRDPAVLAVRHHTQTLVVHVFVGLVNFTDALKSVHVQRLYVWLKCETPAVS